MGAIYHILSDTPKVHWSKYVWNRVLIPKHRIILWLLLHERLPVRAFLAKFFQNFDSSCGICQQPEETHEHLFFDCVHARALTNRVLNYFKAFRCPSSMFQWSRWILQRVKDKTHRSLLMCASASIHYQVWTDRNEAVFNHVQPDANRSSELVIHLVKQRMSFIAMHCKKALMCEQFCT